MKLLLLPFLIVVALVLTGVVNAQITPLRHGHAHNDYAHARPLFEALENGFTSIEIDVYLHNEELKVSHLPVGLDKKQNIEQLYLEPIKKVIEENNGTVYKGYNIPVIFMIDFKTGGMETYNQLKEVLKNYESIITVYKGDSVLQQRAINILISGNSPLNERMKEETSMVTIDADISALGNPAIDKATARYSSGWENYFSWGGKGTMPSAQKATLDALVAKAHEKNKQIRFYHIPDKPNAWKTLLDAGVDWINTNQLKEYRKFYEENYAK